MLHLRQLLRRYAEYRRVGYGRLAAFRFAWLVVTPRKPLSARIAAHPDRVAAVSSFASICPTASTTASNVSMVEAWRAL